ncbi:uncharacterized protein [Littorina saxatilis]|uniref:uncharacterized protein n=1 Tax=Littorina saxatilis TaxID=31220 RepID=UPI0038B5188C
MPLTTDLGHRLKPADKPHPPSQPEVVNPDHKFIKLKWEPPSNDSGAPITGYDIERKESKTNRWTKINKNPLQNCTFKDDKVKAEHEYEYRVVANNRAGPSEPSPPTPARATKKCRRCTRTFEPSVLEVFFPEVNIEDLLSSKIPKGRKPNEEEQKINENIKTKRGEFKKLFCALLNCLEDNAVIFHVEDTRILDKHDIAWNDELMQFVSDNSCYHDVFERVIIDKKHFRVRVKPRKDSECVMSTLCFHSSLSRDKGLDNHPSHHKFQRVMENARDGHGYCNETLFNLPDDTAFKLGKEVDVKGHPNGSVPFQECMWLQAKRIERKLEPEQIVDIMWEEKTKMVCKHELGRYISAFSKVPGGGIIYFGICEKPGNDKNIKIKNFVSEGVEFRLQDFCNLKQLLNKKMENLLWVRAPSQSDNDQSENIPVLAGRVDVFRLSEGLQSRCIIKITVKQFQGVCFFRKEGPESYVLNDQNVPVPVTDWVEWAEMSHCNDFVHVEVQFHWQRSHFVIS